MDIKQFKEISNLQRMELYSFIKSVDLYYNKTYIEMIKIYESDTFNGGDSIFILFNNGQVKGSIAVITKEISIKGEVYITDIYTGDENLERNLCILIEKTIEYCSICSARIVKIGVRGSEMNIIPHIVKMEFVHIYDAVIMKYGGVKDKTSKLNKEIDVVPLSILNSHEYMSIHNKAFENSPNGGTIDEIDVKDYIVRYANNEDLIGICYFEKEACGIYELSLNGKLGWIDTIGIAPKYQKKGLGRALIMQCIEKLWENNVDEIKLLVITSNEIAVKMYKENGFEEEKVFSYWFEKLLVSN